MYNSICTHSGLEFNFYHPSPDMIRIADISVALSRIPRYAGHTRVFYSVAEHSVRVAKYLKETGYPVEVVRLGLLHDASEAYMMDIPSPLKGLLPDYKHIERKVQYAINDRFGLSGVPYEDVKDVDVLMMRAEKRDLMPECDWWEEEEPSYLEYDQIVPVSSQESEMQFTKMFGELFF